MLDKPQIVQTTARPTAFIHLTVPRAEVQNVMGPGLQEVLAAVAAQGSTPAGPWFTHHLKMEPGVFDFEISVPVTKPISAAGRVQPGQWPAMKMARTTYHGPYDDLGSAWGEFDAWIAAAGHSTAADLWEVYSLGPEAGSDPAGWSTELSRRLAG
jgi:effector-binding domain-containing protein